MADYRYLKIKMDSALHERLSDVADYNRRDVHNEVLWVLERHVELSEGDISFRSEQYGSKAPSKEDQ